MAHNVFIDANTEYVMGHLRSGHYEGILELTDEEFEEFKKDPTQFLNENDVRYDLDFLVDDYEIYEIGHIESPEWRELPNE